MFTEMMFLQISLSFTTYQKLSELHGCDGKVMAILFGGLYIYKGKRRHLNECGQAGRLWFQSLH